MTSVTLIHRLTRETTGKNPAAAKLANYILSNRKATAESTLLALADNADVSYATVCRFIKKMGCGGFKSFRALLTETPVLPETDTPRAADSSGTIANICDLSISMIESCRRSLDPSSLKKITDMLTGASQILIAGLGTSAVTAQYAYIKLFRLRLPCIRDTDMILLRMKASLLRRGDVLLAISSSGRTKAILDTARQARISGATVISLCDYTNSPLARLSEICIATTSRDSGADPDMDLPLIQGQLTLIDILYTHLCNQIGGQGFQHTKESVREEKTSAQIPVR